MRRALLATLTVVALVGLLAMPAGATHVSKTPVTISVNSAAAGVCTAKPGKPVITGGLLPGGLQSAIDANQALTNGAKIPSDLLGSGLSYFDQSGACQYGTDQVWNASPVRVPGCGLPTKNDLTACDGISLPGFGPPVRPGRFLQHVNGFDPASLAAVCRFVSTGTPNQGQCRTVAFGFVLQGLSGESDQRIRDTGLGGYCGSSRGFFWAMGATNATMTDNPVFSFAEWKPNSAGTILPITGATIGANWDFNAHFTSFSVPDPRSNMAGYTASYSVNIYALATARSYVPGDADQSTAATRGSCAGTIYKGGTDVAVLDPREAAKQFLAQAVTIQLGP